MLLWDIQGMLHGAGSHPERAVVLLLWVSSLREGQGGAQGWGQHPASDSAASCKLLLLHTLAVQHATSHTTLRPPLLFTLFLSLLSTAPTSHTTSQSPRLSKPLQ